MPAKPTKPTETAATREIHWVYYHVELQARERICGGVPKSAKLIDDWLAARAPERLPAGVTSGALPNLAALSEQVKAEMGEAQLAEAEAAESRIWTGFKRLPPSEEWPLGQPYVESRQVKSMFKEASNITKGLLGVKNARSKLAERLFVRPHRIPILNAPRGPLPNTEQAIHVLTAQGPRTALKRFDYVPHARLAFDLQVLDEGPSSIFDEAYLDALLMYASENGLGASRSQEEGQFDVEVFERVDAPVVPEPAFHVAPEVEVDFAQ